MTSKAANRRLDLVASIVNTQPLSQQALNELYAKFLKAGELPNDARTARAVVERALVARRSGGITRQEEGLPIAGPPREQVLREAAQPFDVPRKAARLLIEILVEGGGDPTDPEFIPSDYEIPEFGSVAMHILGWPDRLVRPPYEQQMQRVLQQHAQLRAYWPRTDMWYRDAADALASFLTRGELPRDDVFQLYALTIGEMFAIHAHYCGRGGENLLAAYDAVATAPDEERADALRRLGELQAREDR